MTIQGAIAELQNLINANDVPFYYKGGIQKVIETISMELVEQNATLKALERRINLHEKAMATVMADRKTEPITAIMPKAQGRKQAFATIDEIYAMADRKTEPQSCDICKHNGVNYAYNYACDKCTYMDKYEPLTERRKNENLSR